MSDRTWKLPWNRLDLGRLTDAAAQVAKRYHGVTVVVEDEGEGIHTAFFTVPVPADTDDEDAGEFAEDDEGTVEISLYEMDADGVLMSLEGDASDNSWLEEEADQIADDLADALGGMGLDL